MSTSSSDPQPGRVPKGSRDPAVAWLGSFFATLILSAGLLYAFLIVVDPYDSGRLWSLPIAGVNDHGPRTADVSLARDPRFDAAVFGNSIGLPLQPARLSRATGLSFVQLALPATGPLEQLAVMDWFIQHHERIGGLVIIADVTWCNPNPSPPLLHPFPFWLYSRGNTGYLAHLLSTFSIRQAVRRIGLGLGWLVRSDPAGFCGDCSVINPRLRPRLPGTLPDLDSKPATVRADLRFAGIDRLDALLAQRETPPPIVILMAPAFVTTLPARGTEEDVVMESCKARFAEFAVNHPASRFIDRRVDGPVARNPDNFRDPVHMSPARAEQIEHDIVAAMAAVTKARDISQAIP